METLGGIKELFHRSLNALFDKEEIDSMFFISLEALLYKSRLDYVQERDFIISDEQSIQFKGIVERLKTHEPIQYILGETEFFGLKIKVNKQVLIPRQETEELIDLILKSESINKLNSLHILDVGTGSGCIAIALKKKLDKAQVFAVDVSAQALELARENAFENEVDVIFKNHDILSKDSLVFRDIDHGVVKYDIIVSNPPYVRRSEKHEMKPNVLNFEPDLALFVDDNDPLVFYDVISDFAVNNLKPNGWLYYEINQYLGEKMMQMLLSKGFKNIEIRKDLLGNDRMVKAQLE